MNHITRAISASLALALGAATPALAHHHHFTVDTASGSPGDKIFVVAGYLPDDPFTFNEDGVLMNDDIPAVFTAELELTQGDEFAGWWAGDELTLSSDYYFATGRLDGGDFRFELVSVVSLGAEGDRIAWGMVNGGAFEASARSDGADRVARSFDVGAGSHMHGQYLAVDAPGLYEITMIAWDANGVYADSDPVTFRVLAGEICLADFDLSGFVDFDDFNRFVAAFEAGADEADVDGSGFVDFDDFNFYVGHFEAGC